MKSSFTNLALSFGAALLFFTASGSVAQTAESKNVSKVSITVLPNLVKFDVTRFDVTAGAEVELDFSNPCVLPHNLVLVQPEAEAALTTAVGAMGLEGMEKRRLCSGINSSARYVPRNSYA